MNCCVTVSLNIAMKLYTGVPARDIIIIIIIIIQQIVMCYNMSLDITRAPVVGIVMKK